MNIKQIYEELNKVLHEVDYAKSTEHNDLYESIESAMGNAEIIADTEGVQL